MTPELQQFQEVAKEALKHRDTPNYWGLTRPETPEDALTQAAKVLVVAELDNIAYEFEAGGTIDGLKSLNSRLALYMEDKS